MNLLEGVTTIDVWAFENCKALKEVNFSSTVTTINSNAFSGSGLSSVSIPKTVTTLGGSVFSNCKSLISVSIAKGVVDLGPWIFDNCDNLEEVSFAPRILTSSLFRNLKALKKVTLSEEVATIDVWAFENSNKLTTLIIKAATPPTLNNGALNNTALTHIYVPAASVDTYKNDRKWGVFADKIQAIP